MGLNSDIAEVISQIDKIITEKSDKWLNISDYNIWATTLISQISN